MNRDSNSRPGANRRKRSAEQTTSAAGSAAGSAAEIVARLAAREEAYGRETILAPVLEKNSRIRVRLDGIVYELALEETDFRGWALLQITKPGQAKVIGAAGPDAIKRYLQLLVRVRLVVLEIHQGNWWAIPAMDNDPRLEVKGVVPVHLAERVAGFDTIYVRFDGASFLFEGIDRRHDPARARKLRQLLNENLAPNQVTVPGIVPAERRAYEMLYLLKNPHLRSGRGTTSSGDEQKDKITSSLAHAGAELDAFWSPGTDLLAVRFILDGQTHTATFTKDLSLVSAGVCLQGEDHKFDLASLAGVLRQYRTEEPDW